MSLIHIANLTFSYQDSYDDVFTNVSVQIDTDWKLGFCGRNGRGKTTFLNLLMGKYMYSGKIVATVAFDYFPVEVENPDDSALEVLERIVPHAQEWQLQKELSKLDADDGVLYRIFSTLSNGERTKVLLAGLFLRENNFLLIDEPTNHLDAESRLAVARYLKSKQGFILVSHDRVFLDECVDHILSINRNEIEVMNGNFTTWAEQKKLRDASELAKNERLKQEIGRLEKAASQTADWSQRAENGKFGIQNSGLKVDRGYVGHKAAKIMKRSKAIERRQDEAILEKSRLLKNIERADGLKIQPLVYHAERLLSLRNVTITYDGRTILDHFSFDVKRGERISLSGKNGSGKSSILKLISGKDIPHTGQVHIGSRLLISHVPQDANDLSGSLSAFAELHKINETLFYNILHKLDFSRVQLEKDLCNYSAGQKKKVLIARSLCEQAHLYIWDEPLNYMDILSRMQIEDLILTYAPTMIFVEHDRAFCDTIATTEIIL